MPVLISALMVSFFLMLFFGLDELAVPFFVVFIIAIALYLGKGENGGGWFRYRRGDPDPTPTGPGPLPTKWDPPDYLPEWVVEEQLQVVTKGASDES